MDLSFYKTEEFEKLTQAEAEEILQQVFMNCYEDSNSIPVEQLELYANYRTERLGLQRIVSTIGLIAFIIIPLWFVPPKFTVSEPEIGSRGLPSYSIDVGGILPIHSVAAVQKGLSIPVYQDGKRSFTIEPTTNGEVSITVSLFSGQWLSKTAIVSGLDTTSPTLEGSSLDGTTLYLYVDDKDGIAYGNVKAVAEDGTVYYPSDFDSREGYIEFTNLTQNVTVSVPDSYGNVLSIHVNNR